MAGSPGGKEVGRLALKVLPDTSDFLPQLKAFAEQVEEQVKIELALEIDTAPALADVKQFQAQMQAADLGIDVDLDVPAYAQMLEAATPEEAAKKIGGAELLDALGNL